MSILRQRTLVVVAAVAGLLLTTVSAESRPRKPKKAKIVPVKPAPVKQAKIVEAWAVGVSDSDQKTALDLFAEGNKLYARQQYADALQEYTQALSHWDHPAIHFNMAVCLIHQGKSKWVDAYDDLNQAMKHGDAPLGPRMWEQAENYNELLSGHLGTLTVQCKQEGVEISLDGKPFLSCPGKQEATLLPGEHQLVAGKKDFLTGTRNIRLPAGEKSVENIRLVSLADAPVILKRRFSRKLPWIVTGVGTGIALIGGGLYFKTGNSFEQYERDVSEQCPDGCLNDELLGSVQATKDQAELENVLAISALAVGGSAIATGIVLFVLNQPRPTSFEQGPTITPIATPGGAGVSLTLPF